MRDHLLAILCVLGMAAVSGCGGGESRGRAGAEPSAGAEADEAAVLRTTGQTMGTYYAVTIADPPQSLPDDWRQRIDAELRRVNDQMSTYLESSEVSRFNDSQSTDWFPVSAETAMVVATAQEVSRATDGAFDVTVGPLVDAWNFGPGERTQHPPSEAEIARLRKAIGYQHLEVRREPAALRKDIPELRIDLSAIAKGHGVDRILALLIELGCDHVFVDIGGEDRAIGRRGNRAWRVAIEHPDPEEHDLPLAIELQDMAIATSGDYRNFFEYEGKRYSHTIDPRTGRPVTHGVASVSVVAEDCMTADAWATALTVLGRDEGMEIARDSNLTARIVVRQADGQFVVVQTDDFPASIFPLAGANQ